MRRALFFALTGALFSTEPVMAQDKSFELKIGESSIGIDAGETVEMTLPDGSKTQVTLTANPFRTFKADEFSFAHPAGVSVTKSDLGGGVTQYLMATAIGTMAIVQTYKTLDPTTLTEMMLSEMTRDAVAIGAKVEKKLHSRMAGQKLSGLHAVETGERETIEYEILAHGAGRSGVLVITRLDEENRDDDEDLLTRFWESLKVN